MSNIYLLSNELCDFCDVPHGSKMHIKQIVRIVEDYIKNLDHFNFIIRIMNANNSKFIPGYAFICTFPRMHFYNDTLLENQAYSINAIRFDSKLAKIFSNIPNDTSVIKHIELYIDCHEKHYNHQQTIGNNPYSNYERMIEEAKLFTHNFKDIDMYLEMSGHLTHLSKVKNNKTNNIKSIKI